MNIKSKVYILLISLILLFSSCSFNLIEKKFNENGNGTIVLRTINRSVPLEEGLSYKATMTSTDGEYSKTIEVKDGDPIIFDKLHDNIYKINIQAFFGYYEFFGEVEVPYVLGTDPEVLEIQVKLDSKAVKGQFGLQFNSVKLYDNAYFNVTIKDKTQKIVWEEKDIPSSSIIENKYVIPLYLPEDEYYISLTGGNTDKELYSVNNNNKATIHNGTVSYYDVASQTFDNVLYVRSGGANGDGSRGNPFNSIKGALDVLGENENAVTLSLLGDITEGVAIPEITRPLRLSIIGSPESMSGSATITASNGLFNLNNPSSVLILRNIKLDANNTPINVTSGSVILDTDTNLSAAQDVISLGSEGNVQLNDNATISHGSINISENSKVFALSYLTTQTPFTIKGPNLKTGTQVLFTGKNTSYSILASIYTKFSYVTGGKSYSLDSNGAITSTIYEIGGIAQTIGTIKAFAFDTKPSLNVIANVKSDSELEELGRALRSVPLTKTVNLTINGTNGFSTISSSINRDGNGIQTLSTLTFGEGITRIGTDSFKNCSKLTSISFPDSLLYIEDNAFDECRSLQTLELPPNLLEVGTNNIEGNIQAITFKGASDTLWEVSNSKERFTCSQSNGVPNMENFVNNKNYKITRILKGNEISSLLNNIVNDNLSISLNLDDNSSILSIPSSYKGELTVNVVGQSINDSAFKNCNSLKRLNIASSVSKIGNGILEGVTDVDVVIDSENKNYKVSNNCIMSKYDSKLIQAINKSSSSSLKIPSNTIFIQAKAFSGSNLSSITFSNSKPWFSENKLTFNPDPSSNYASDLKTGLASSNVVMVHTVDEAISYIPTIPFGETVQLAVNAEPGNIESLNTPIQKCKGKVELNLLPSTSLTSLPSSCLAYNPGLVKVLLPDSLKEISESAFKGSSLTEVRLPSTLEIIGEDAFYETNLTSISLPPTLKAIQNYALWKNNNLKEITIPSSVIFIGYLAFPFDNNQEGDALAPATPKDPKIYFEDTTPYKVLKGGIINPKLNTDNIQSIKDSIYSVANNQLIKAISYDEASSILTSQKYPIGSVLEYNGKSQAGSMVVNVKNITQTQLNELCSKAKSYEPTGDSSYFDFAFGMLYGEGNPSTYLSIPDDAFTGNMKVSKICIPKNVNKIGKNALTGIPIFEGSGSDKIRDFDFEDLSTTWKNETSGTTITLQGKSSIDLAHFFQVPDASFSIVP